MNKSVSKTSKSPFLPPHNAWHTRARAAVTAHTKSDPTNPLEFFTIQKLNPAPWKPGCHELSLPIIIGAVFPPPSRAEVHPVSSEALQTGEESEQSQLRAGQMKACFTGLLQPF